MKNIFLYTILICFAVFGLNACGGYAENSIANANKTVVNTAEKAANTAGNAVNTVTNAINNVTTSSPASFMEEAAQGGYAEVEMGRLAVSKARDPEVKKFGQMMIDDHSKANTELKAIAGSKKMTLPPDMGAGKKTYDQLKDLSGADFDKAYVKAMVDDHEEDVTAFQKQANNSTDPEVKAFAAKVLPVIKKHLDAIKAIQAKMK